MLLQHCIAIFLKADILPFLQRCSNILQRFCNITILQGKIATILLQSFCAVWDSLSYQFHSSWKKKNFSPPLRLRFFISSFLGCVRFFFLIMAVYKACAFFFFLFSPFVSRMCLSLRVYTLTTVLLSTFLDLSSTLSPRKTRNELIVDIFNMIFFSFRSSFFSF